MIFDLSSGHLGDVLLAAPAMREGDKVVAQPRARVSGLPVEWLDVATGALVRQPGTGHETDAWLEAAGRKPKRHGLLAPVERTDLVVAPAVGSPRRAWSRWGELGAALPGAIWLGAVLGRALWMASLNRAHTVVCPDTGTAHMADALGVPRVIALHGMGQRHFRRFRPYWNASHCIVRDSMDQISVDDVLEAVRG